MPEPSSRVLHVVLSLNPGGTERLVIELAKRLNSRIPSAVCCLDESGSWAHELTSLGIIVTGLNRTPGFHPALAIQLARVARRHQATIIHAHHYSPFVYSALARLSRPSMEVIFTEHGRLSDQGPSGKRRIANHLLSFAPAGVFAVSAELGEHLIAEGFRRSQVNVIYNGIDLGSLPTQEAREQVRRELSVDDKTCVIGTIARLDPVKDLSNLIEAVQLISSDGRNVCLILIGDGPERANLENQVRQAGLTRVLFLGQRADARRWLVGCDIYVNCSTSEGISLTILEAMAAGLPIIATAVGGTPEVVDNTCGRMVLAKNSGALAQAITDLMNSPAERISLGRAARARVESRFTLDRMVSEYAEVYVRD